MTIPFFVGTLAPHGTRNNIFVKRNLNYFRLKFTNNFKEVSGSTIKIGKNRRFINDGCPIKGPKMNTNAPPYNTGNIQLR